MGLGVIGRDRSMTPRTFRVIYPKDVPHSMRDDHALATN
jgi:hypothetical protein